MAYMNTTLVIDAEVRAGMDSLPRRQVSSSAVFRWAILAATSTDAGWHRACKERPELVEVTEFLRSRMVKVFK
jgi:hypothetical protein